MALGIAVIFQSSAVAFGVLKVVGALYLAYLAWQAFRASVSTIEATRSTRRSGGALYRRGIIMNITNPKVSVFFLAFLPQFASPEGGRVGPQILLLGGVFICVALVVFSAIAFFSGILGGWLQRSLKARVYLNRVAGTVFGVLALTLVTASTEGQ